MKYGHFLQIQYIASNHKDLTILHLQQWSGRIKSMNRIGLLDTTSREQMSACSGGACPALLHDTDDAMFDVVVSYKCLTVLTLNLYYLHSFSCGENDLNQTLSLHRVTTSHVISAQRRQSSECMTHTSVVTTNNCDFLASPADTVTQLY